MRTEQHNLQCASHGQRAYPGHAQTKAQREQEYLVGLKARLDFAEWRASSVGVGNRAQQGIRENVSHRRCGCGTNFRLPVDTPTERECPRCRA